jgi:LmbE family N-acetylglucosaminyl deacetylase
MTDQRLRFLVVMAHAHDFCEVAGTCGIHMARGDSVTVAILTTGAATHNEQLYRELSKPESERDTDVIGRPAADYIRQKEDELRRVTALFGVTDVRMLGYPDRPFVMAQHPSAVTDLRDIILDVRPHVLIAQSPYLTGPNGLSSGEVNDHTETAFATQQARSLAALTRHGQTVAPHRIAACYFPGDYFAAEHWDFVVDVGDWYEKRVEAETLFGSQSQTREYARKRIDVSLGHAGSAVKIAYGEPYVRERPQLVDHIAVPEPTLRHAAEWGSWMDRVTGSTRR